MQRCELRRWASYGLLVHGRGHGYCCLMTTVAYVSASPPQVTVRGKPVILMKVFCDLILGLNFFFHFFHFFFQSDLNDDHLKRWQSLLTSGPDISRLLGDIERELQVNKHPIVDTFIFWIGVFQHGLPNPFKLVGIDCISLLEKQGETKTPEGLN